MARSGKNKIKRESESEEGQGGVKYSDWLILVFYWLKGKQFSFFFWFFPSTRAFLFRFFILSLLSIPPFFLFITSCLFALTLAVKRIMTRLQTRTPPAHSTHKARSSMKAKRVGRAAQKEYSLLTNSSSFLAALLVVTLMPLARIPLLPPPLIKPKSAPLVQSYPPLIQMAQRSMAQHLLQQL